MADIQQNRKLRIGDVLKELDYINDEIVKLGKENFFHKDFEKTLKPVYGDEVNPDDIVVESGVIEK